MKATRRNQSHGMSNTPEYRSWAAMRHRCNNPRVPAYKNYGARGIAYCRQWDDFLTFYRDMGPRPAGATLDRIDNNGDYSPDNCRWATASEQANNKRNSKFITYKGKTKTVAQWADDIGVCVGLLRSRVDAGWPVEKVFGTPFEKFTTLRALIDHYAN